MAKITPRTLSGFKDFLPKEAVHKENLLHQLIAIFRSFGFLPIETPHLEYAEVLLKQGSDEIQKELYRFKDHGGRDVALRFDLTLPLARYISQHRHEVGIPFKRYAIGNVFRGERAQKGRYREFTQCDFDFIGSDSLVCDAEIVQLICAALESLNVGGFKVFVNHRKILNGIAEIAGVSEKIQDLLRIIDKLDKIGSEGVSAELEKELGLSAKSIQTILELVNLKQTGDAIEFIDSVINRYSSVSLNEGLNELKIFFQILTAANIADKIKIQFSIARGLGYYTGIVYETLLDVLPSIGSVCSGGRYDYLTQNFSEDKLSGVGASIGLDRLLAALDELKLHQQKFCGTLVIVMDSQYFPYGVKVATQLRMQGNVVELYPDIVKLKKSLGYANLHGYDQAAIIGEEEVKEQEFTLKNMQTGEQQRIKLQVK
ncbi:histidine--tRNA ligase [Helicobacter monodelphidis]|uniref:histidine--tRNA ligase n=1 Tax=Helicobacter sp. 15-1451 TaxID=2004995 RepID=UPI000DCC8EF9|nr:histidine--tRNA ligase [Helicobacter sp. 15-1451]RAX58901.1 histidine--tRNA ligase [Helicobacter sp. 15-1451]